MTFTVVELEYYESNGKHACSTEYRTSESTVDGLGEELSRLNREGRMPAVGGPVNGFVALSITGKKKDSMALLTLRGIPQ